MNPLLSSDLHTRRCIPEELDREPALLEKARRAQVVVSDTVMLGPSRKGMGSRLMEVERLKTCLNSR